MSTRKLIKGDRYRAGLWKLEERCYEAHVRMPNAKFMIRTYRCTQGEAVAKFDSWVEAEGLDLAEDGAREACEGSIDDGMGTARRPLNREERRAMERRDRKIKKRQARKAASEADADIDGLRAENARLRADAEAWEEIATDQERSYSDATAKVDELTRTVQRLEGEKRALERALERKAAQCAAPSDDDGAARVAECLQSIPCDLTDLLKLARSIWPERIVVLPEAMDSAKSYDGNLAEEWDIVRSTATALYGLLFEDDGCKGQVADEFQRRTGYELTFSESSATRARADLMKMRERSYGGRTVDISAHIKGRSQKNTFRLHFYIDRENELIVIGHAGCHMKTAGSHRRGFK